MQSKTSIKYIVCYTLDAITSTFVPQLRNIASQNCMDTMGQSAPAVMGMSHCHGQGNNQVKNVYMS